MSPFPSPRLIRQGFSVIESLVMLGLLVIFSMVVIAVARKQWQTPEAASTSADLPAATPVPASSNSVLPPASPKSSSVELPAPAGQAGSPPPSDPQ